MDEIVVAGSRHVACVYLRVAAWVVLPYLALLLIGLWIPTARAAVGWMAPLAWAAAAISVPITCWWLMFGARTSVLVRRGELVVVRGSRVIRRQAVAELEDMWFAPSLTWCDLASSMPPADLPRVWGRRRDGGEVAISPPIAVMGDRVCSQVQEALREMLIAGQSQQWRDGA